MKYDCLTCRLNSPDINYSCLIRLSDWFRIFYHMSWFLKIPLENSPDFLDIHIRAFFTAVFQHSLGKNFLLITIHYGEKSSRINTLMSEILVFPF